jgi:hypothetical protein
MAAMSVVVAILAITLETVTAAHETAQRDGHVAEARSELASDETPASASTRKVPQSLWAQNWRGELTFSVNPRLGRALPERASDSIADFDESDGGLRLAITRLAGDRRPRLQIAAGVRSVPQYFDDRDPSSVAFGEITIGDNTPYRELVLMDPQDNPSTDQVTDNFEWYLRYRHSANFNDFLQSRARSENAITAGIRIRDVKTIMCSQRGLDSAVEIGACSNTPGVYWEGSFAVTNIWSSNSGLNRLEPNLEFAAYSRPIRDAFRFFGGLSGNYSYYDSAVTSDGDLREDFRVRATIGIDFTDYLRSLGPRMSASVGLQWQRRWSNDSNQQHERLYFVPGFNVVGRF